jgi:hypothetical protein
MALSLSTRRLRWLLTSVLIFNLGLLSAQDIPIDNQKFILFPHPMNSNWRVSIGFSSTTMPREITEEVHYRVPSGDLHVLKRISNHLSLDSRLYFQIVQNLLLIGPKLTGKLTDRISYAVGDDVGFWFGRIKAGQINTTGRGYQNYPYVALGYRGNKQIFLTIKAESIQNFNIDTKAGNTPVKSDYRFFSGSAYTVALEQPFVGKHSMTLGFRAIYTDYYWQTWTLFERYDRNLFFPQLIVGLIL